MEAHRLLTEANASGIGARTKAASTDGIACRNMCRTPTMIRAMPCILISQSRSLAPFDPARPSCSIRKIPCRSPRYCPSQPPQIESAGGRSRMAPSEIKTNTSLTAEDFSQSTNVSRHLKECAAAGREDHGKGRRPARWTTLNFFLRRYGHASPSPLSLLRTRGMQSSSSCGTESASSPRGAGAGGGKGRKGEEESLEASESNEEDQRARHSSTGTRKCASCDH